MKLDQAQHIIVFQKGGEWTFRQLAVRQGFDFDDPRVRRLITQRQNHGTGVEILNPEVLADISPNERVIGIEDLVDKYVTVNAVRTIIPTMEVHALVAKSAVVDPIPDYVSVMATIDPKLWIGGIGADFGPTASELYGYPVDFPREYGGIVVMPESLTDKSIS